MAESKEGFRKRVRLWSERLNVSPASVRVQRMTRKWASCSGSGTMSFAIDLLSRSAQFRDYVIVHELLHLRVANHGKLFKALLGLHIPNWRQIERQHGPTKRAAGLQISAS